MDTEHIRFSQRITFGYGLIRRKEQDAEIIFENMKTRVRKIIVNENGRILDFPGLAHPELVSQYVKVYLGEQIRYRSEIELLDGQYALIWQIQPDGRYWEDDDGFGGTSDDEIDLYARLDETGNFIEPFRFYSIGSNKLYGTYVEEKLLKTMAMKDDPLQCLQAQVPIMLDELKERIKIPTKGIVEYNIPGTVYQARLTLDCSGKEWFVRANMLKTKSDTGFMGWLKYLPLDEQRRYLTTDQAREDATQTLTSLFYTIKREE